MNVYQRLNLAREAFHGSKLKKQATTSLPTTTTLSWPTLSLRFSRFSMMSSCAG